MDAAVQNNIKAALLRCAVFEVVLSQTKIAWGSVVHLARGGAGGEHNSDDSLPAVLLVEPPEPRDELGWLLDALVEPGPTEK